MPGEEKKPGSFYVGIEALARSPSPVPGQHGYETPEEAAKGVASQAKDGKEDTVGGEASSPAGGRSTPPVPEGREGASVAR